MTTEMTQIAPTAHPLLDRILGDLTPAQRAAVMHGVGPALVAAGAGSGKTKVITHRIARLVLVEGVDPSRVLAVTFSKAGAEEMTSRVRALGCPAEVRTFHALALRICKRELWGEGINVGDARYPACVKQALDETEKRSIRIDPTIATTFIDRAKSALLIPCEADAAAAWALAESVSRELTGAQPYPAEAQGLLDVYVRAEELRAERRIITFADMICHAVRFLRDDEAGRTRWAAQYDYVIQDECQDQDPAQLLFASLLAQGHRNYMIVGDPAQSIYGFRGADPTFMVRFLETWGGARYSLDTNFRSGARIIEAANTLCGDMPVGSHLGIEMKPSRQLVGGGAITVQRDVTSDTEALRIATEIKGALDHGSAPDDYAVLLRTGAHSAAIEDAFLRAEIPYHLAIGVSFYGRKEVGILVSYLRLISKRYTADDIGRAIKHPTRYVGGAFVDALAAVCAEPGADETSWASRVQRALRTSSLRGGAPRAVALWADLMDELTRRSAEMAAAETGSEEAASGDTAPVQPEAILRAIIERTGYLRWLARDEGLATADDARSENVARLVERAARFATIEQMLSFIDEALAQPSGGNKPEGKVVITTIHRSKGLEWPVVYLPAFIEGVIPHARAKLDEERRLAYVAITRARDVLKISAPRVVRLSEDVTRPADLSSFVADAGLE